MTHDLARLAAYFNVPLHPPSDPAEAMFRKGTRQVKGVFILKLRKGTNTEMFYFFLLVGSLNAMRFVKAVQEKATGGDQQVEKVSRELWRRIWSEDKDITEPASLAEVATHSE